MLKILKGYTQKLSQVKDALQSTLQPASGAVLLADAAATPFLFAKKKKRKAAPKPAAKPAAPSGVKPKKAKRRVPVAEPRKSGSGTMRAERFFTKIDAKYAAAGYGSTDYARIGILGAGLLAILYYAFQAGGYFVAERSYGGLWILYLVVLGLLFSLQLKGGMPRLGRFEVGIFAAFALWNLASVTWSYYPSKSFDEFIRAMLYLAGFGLFYLYMARREWLSWIGHLFVVIAMITAIDALLGKTLPELVTHPDIFGANRLNYPITYWNTMAVFMGMAFLLGLRVIADKGTRLLTRCLYGPMLFIFLVVIFYTVSRAGIVLLAAAIGVTLVTSRFRLRAVMQAALAFFWMLVVVAISYAWLPAMIESKPAEDLRNSQGQQLALALLLLVLLVAGTQWLLRQLEDRISIGVELGRKIGIALAVAGGVVLLAGFMGYTSTGSRGGPIEWTGNRIEAFTSTTRAESTERVEERLFSSQSERYQEYKASWSTFKEHPLTGTGAATWNVSWLKYRPYDMISKDGHSWFFENLAELGIVGAGLMTAFVIVFLMISIGDLRFMAAGRDRELYGTFFAACLMLLVHAMIDWDWEMPVIFMTFFMFAGALLRYGQLVRVKAEGGDAAVEAMRAKHTAKDGGASRELFGWAGILGVLCILGMLVTIPPMLAANKMEKVKELDRKGDVANVDKTARDAQKYNPLDGEPIAYEAKAKMALGKLDEAEALLLESLEIEPMNDKTWRVLTRVYVQTKQTDKAVAAIRKSRELNPLESQDTGPVEEQVRAIGGILDYRYGPGGVLLP
ncbi:MAG: O-antigen ligase family protein [Actinobacteria bacterium]|nr:O-antigen ligase family protein [Actinomycetota bacterium]